MSTFSAVTGLPQLHIDMSCPSPIMARVVVVGEVDLASAVLLRDRLLRVLHDQTPAVIHIDLTGVAFLDCTGIGALVAVYNTALRSGCQLRVTHPQPIVRQVLEVTGLLGVLTAPIEQREPLPPESRYRPKTGSATATMAGTVDLTVFPA
jgi:anti-anti-sigma factor